MNTNLAARPVARTAPRPALAARANGAAVNYLVAPSVRVPTTHDNRAYLRAARAAESARWESQVAHADRAALRKQVARIARHKKKEAWTYGLLALISAGSVGYAVADSFRLFKNWPAFVQMVQAFFA